jgi:hypothetical protein
MQNLKIAPTYNEITWYLAGGIYYDANQRWGAGENEKGGLWLKKKTKIIADDTKGRRKHGCHSRDLHFKSKWNYDSKFNYQSHSNFDYCT